MRVMIRDRSGCRLRRLTVGALLCTGLVAGGCGTRASEADKLAARGLANPQPVAQVSNLPAGFDATVPSDGTATDDGTPVNTGGADAGAPAGAAGGTAAAPTVPGGGTKPSSSGAARTTGSSAPTGSGALSASAGSAGAPTGGSAPAAPGAPSPGAPAAPGPPGGPKAPITIGNVSTLSGPAASGELPGLDGLQIWVKWINAQGGVKGHVIKLVVADDNSDGARHRQLVQELVEQKGVVTFVQQGEALTGAGSVDYLTKKGVAVINSEGANDYFYKSPVYFPLVAHGEQLIKASLYNVSRYAKLKQKTKYIPT